MKEGIVGLIFEYITLSKIITIDGESLYEYFSQLVDYTIVYDVRKELN